MSCNRALSSMSIGLLISSACLGCSGPNSPTPVTSAAISTSASTPSITVQGTVVSEAGAPLVGGALTFATGSGQAKAVSDASGHYQVSFAPTQSWGGHVDVDGYESTYRDSYFEAGPGVLNFRMFRLLRVTAGDAVRVTITNDGSVCGLEDEWLCRTVRVVAGRAGTLAVSVARNDSSSPAAVTIRENYYPPLVSVAVMAGEEVEVELLLPWSSSGGGVTLSTSIQ